jgi:hypothetical protein
MGPFTGDILLSKHRIIQPGRVRNEKHRISPHSIQANPERTDYTDVFEMLARGKN